MSILLPAGAALLAAGVPLSALLDSHRPAVGVAVAGALLVVAGAVGVLVDGAPVGAGFRSDVDPAFGMDALSAFFAIVIALGAVPAFVFAADSMAAEPARRTLTALTATFVLSLLGVVAARDVTTLLAFWELMTLVPATAMLFARRDAAVRHAVFVYLAITHIGGAGVWIALLTLAREGAIGGQLAVDGPRTLVLVAALVGFGTKAGIMPLHAWLPRAHPVAPSHLSALMSGVMLKVALYGLVRVLFEWAAPAPRWLGLVIVGVGLLSALGGVLYAVVQPELKRLLAFSSIENVGIIALALGAALILRDAGESVWAAVAFAGAMLHVANHAAFKGLLFLGAGAFGHAAGSLAFDRLGGLLRRMPWTGWSFAIGCMAIAALPPLNGFASEWLVLQSLLHVAFEPAAGVSAVGAVALAGLAATAALAVFCFVKVIGLVLLGAPRTAEAAGAEERPMATRVALVLSAACCVALAVVPGLLLPTLAGLLPGVPALSARAALDPPGTGALPSAVILVALVALAFAVRRLTHGGATAAPTPAWTCGQPAEPPLAWTSAGFTKPLRLVLEVVLRPEREVERVERAGMVRRVGYRLEVPHLFDDLVYGPTQRLALRGAAVARRVQSGSLRAYIFYLLGLVLALLALARIGGLG